MPGERFPAEKCQHFHSSLLNRSHSHTGNVIIPKYKCINIDNFQSGFFCPTPNEGE